MFMDSGQETILLIVSHQLITESAQGRFIKYFNEKLSQAPRYQLPMIRSNILKPAIYVPMADPNEENRNISKMRVTRLCHQPFRLAVSLLRRLKSPTVGLRK